MNAFPIIFMGFIGGLLTMTIVNFYRWFFKHQEEINGTIQRAIIGWKYNR